MCVTLMIAANALDSRPPCWSTQIVPIKNLTEPLQYQCAWACAASSLYQVIVSDGKIAERGSFVDVGDVRNPRTDRKHGCVSANVSRFRVKFGGKLRAVCAQGTAGVAHVSVGRVARYWSQQRRISLERVFRTRFWTAKKRTRF